jgi:hypothetical protein
MRSFVPGCSGNSMCIFSIKQGKDEAKKGCFTKIVPFEEPDLYQQVQGKTIVKKRAAAAVSSS